MAFQLVASFALLVNAAALDCTTDSTLEAFLGGKCSCPKNGFEVLAVAQTAATSPVLAKGVCVDPSLAVCQYEGNFCTDDEVTPTKYTYVYSASGSLK